MVILTLLIGSTITAVVVGVTLGFTSGVLVSEAVAVGEVLKGVTVMVAVAVGVVPKGVAVQVTVAIGVDV